MRPDRYFDWEQLHADEHLAPVVVDPRRRMRILLGGVVLLLAVVFGRLVHLEATEGAAFRAEAARPLVRVKGVPGVRGRILARDGTVLAYDKKVACLAVHYRYLEEPPEARWLRRTARARLTGPQRRDPHHVALEQLRVEAERTAMAQRVARLCGLSMAQWRARAQRIQARVERIAAAVNRRARGTGDKGQGSEVAHGLAAGRVPRFQAWLWELLRATMDEPPAEPITVAEQRDYHVMVEDLPLDVVAEIEAHPELYPGVRILQRERRCYPAGALAAHVLGYTGVAPETDRDEADAGGSSPLPERAGRAGLERHYQRLLDGRRGVLAELTDRSGRVLTTYWQQEPGVGRDLVLTLDSRLQATAETLLASALRRREIDQAEVEPSGGAIVVMHVETGALLAAASAPGFDPNRFAANEQAAVTRVLSDPAHPLLDRVTQMALPPGSVFKVVTAAALLKSPAFDAQQPFVCQGYLDTPDAWRCAIYQRHGIGHGKVCLAEAIAASCNVYFFHHAEQLGPERLVDWARRFGFGRPTGVDLPGEAAGLLPTPKTIRHREGRPWRTADTRSLAIGQSALSATPLQVVRMMAAVANGGRLVTPHVVSRLGLPELDDDQPAADLARLSEASFSRVPPQAIAELDASTLAAIRQGLRRAVADPRGTAYATVRLDAIEIAGKTGTAQCGEGRAEHAWFAGYVPAEHPRWAFVVVLEHAGNAEAAAGPVAKRLVLRMRELGFL